MTTLMRASNEWSSRPADERFKSLQDLHDAVTRFRDIAVEARVPFKSLHAKAVDGAVILNGRTDTQAALTNWSFGQLAQRAGAPPSYLRQLPAALAADCINEGLDRRAEKAEDGEDDAAILFAKTEVLTARAIVTPRYERIWNSDITKRLLALEALNGWHPAPAAFDGSRGLYASDHDMFAFMVDSDRRIFEKLPGGGLSRGFFAWNSEVGDTSFGIGSFLYEYVCGNHRVWGATDYSEIRVAHIGDANDRAFGKLAVELRKYAESSVTETEGQIEAARRYVLGNTKDEVLDAIFALRINGLSRRRVDEAYEKAVEHEDWYGSPRSAWGLAGGLTEIARDIPYADERVALDRAAGKITRIAF